MFILGDKTISEYFYNVFLAVKRIHRATLAGCSKNKGFLHKIRHITDIPQINYLYKYKEKLVILQSIGIIVIKSKETKVITYTCRYSSGNLIPS